MLMIKELIFTLLNKDQKKVLICSLLLDLISSKTVAPQKIWVDGPLSYSSIHKKKCISILHQNMYGWWMEVSKPEFPMELQFCSYLRLLFMLTLSKGVNI